MEGPIYWAPHGARSLTSLDGKPEVDSRKSFPVSDPVGTASCGSKSISPWPQSCLCLGVDVLQNNDKDDVNVSINVFQNKQIPFLVFYTHSQTIEKMLQFFSNIIDNSPNHDFLELYGYETKFCLKFR